MDAIANTIPSTKIHYPFSASTPEPPSPLPQVTIFPNHRQNWHGICKCSLVHCGKLTQRPNRKAFKKIPLRDTFTWNSLIQTHLSNGDLIQVASTYQRMLLVGAKPDRRTLPRVLAASRILGDFPLGKQLHCHVIKYGFASDAYVISALVEMYGQLEGVHAAQRYFQTVKFDKGNGPVVAWTLLAGLYVKNNKPELAIDLFDEIIDNGGEFVDPVALVTIVSACGMLKSLRDGRHAHRVAKDFGLDCDVLVGNALVKMYVDCGNVEDARAVFDGIVCKDAISWTAMIYGYVRKKGEFNEGLKLFRMMNGDGIKADAFAISCVLPACARVTALKNGQEIHGYLLRNGIELNVVVLNALIDMYVKSGSIEYASKVFAEMKQKDVISWTVMILGYSLHGQGKFGVELYREMVKNSTVSVDQMTLCAALYACYSSCMVEEGWHYFNSLTSPTVANCALMVALLSRAGLFVEAKTFIAERNISRHGEVLRALLHGCRIHQDLKTAKNVLEQLLDLEPLNTENYILLSNWYAHHEKWEMVNKLRETITDMNLKPRKAYSWIEFKNKVHVFGTGDISHPRTEAIYNKLHSLLKKVEADKGNLEMTREFSLHCVDEERECDPVGHSELLAVSFGLINAGTAARGEALQRTIRVTKNLAVCQNCHSFAKAVSRETEVEIVIRDPYCFHHFKDGYCSCGDCW